jgi:tetraacyldisaccharide 4'-kinase
MRAPGFWARDGWLPWLLSPAAGITGRLTARRVARLGWQASVPVFCCGNASVGGSGKTTLALDLLQRLQARGLAPHALLRGYGGRQREPLRVDPERHDAAQVGDEALLLAEAAPTWIAADRAVGARLAVAAGAGAIVMDDGLQNPGLAKDCSLLVIDGGAGFGNGRLLPAGPLRESVAAAAARCRAAILIGTDRHGAQATLPPGLPVLAASLMQDLAQLDSGEAYFAFAGIGRPEKFFAGLVAAGVTLRGTESFADHHAYGAGDLARLAESAQVAGGRLLTTPKDAVRLPPAWRPRVKTAGVTLHWQDEAQIEALLDRTLAES